MAGNNKQSFVLYHDIRGPLELLTDEQRGKLFMAILDYSEYGAILDFHDGALDMAFAFIRGALDRDAATWEEKRRKRAKAGSLGGKQTQANRANADFAVEENQMQANQAVPVPVPAPVPVPVPKESKADKPPTPARRKYGSYGWVKLTDDEYNRLEHDLGAGELARCISYIDESAQGTGNKNKWKDWNLVIRRCSREGWGQNRPQGNNRNKLRTETDYRSDDDFFGGEG